MGPKCKIKEEWFQRKDANGHEIVLWAGKPTTGSCLLCKVCGCSINSALKGFQALMQHSSSAKHKAKVQDYLNPSQLVLKAACSSGESSKVTPLPTLQMHSVRDTATIAELIWCMKTVCCNYSAASCSNISEIFKAMFPGAVPEGFSLSPRKMQYLITDALAPYFFQNMLEEAQHSYYTLSYDETTNVENRKELLTTVRYWSESEKRVVTRHLSLAFIGHADATVLHNKITEALNNANLPMSRLLMVASDGPNVNKKVNSLLSEDVLAVRRTGLIDIGTCNIHTVHNAFCKAVSEFGQDACDLVISIYNFFDGWPSRWEDFSKLQSDLKLPSHKFIKHSSTRWLTLETAANRLLEQWVAVVKYFLKLIPQKKSTLMNSNAYKKIVAVLKEPSIKAELLFVVSSASLFTKFTKFFQRTEPLVHVMYVELKNVLVSLMGRVCRQSIVKEVLKEDCSLDVQMLFSVPNLLPVKEITNSNEISSELMKLKEKCAIYFLNGCQKHYVAACKYIIQKTSLLSETLKAFRFLQPHERTLSRSCKDILTIAKLLPLNLQEDVLLDEWKLLQLAGDIELVENEGVDKYWAKILSKETSAGVAKFPTISRVVKASLSLSHGASDIERAFSVSRWVLTEDRAQMSERTLNAIMIVKDSLKLYDNNPSRIPITKKLLSLARCACNSYRNYLEDMKKIEREEMEKAAHEERVKKQNSEKEREIIRHKEHMKVMEATLQEKKAEQHVKRQAGSQLFSEAHSRLKTALEKGDLKGAIMAEAMFDGFNRIREDTEKKDKEVEKLQKEVEKRKSTIISSFCCKKPKL